MQCQNGWPAPSGTCCPAPSVAPAAPPESEAAWPGPTYPPRCEEQPGHCRESFAGLAEGLPPAERSSPLSILSERPLRSEMKI